MHDYSYKGHDGKSINLALVDNSVQYIKFSERVRSLSQVSWYVAVDLKAGYRQMPLIPSDWAMQVYSLGPREFYVDVCMPFGKSNSLKVFCHWITNWVEAFRGW